MTDITPPPELVEKWLEATRSNDCIGAYPQNYEHLVAIQAARWGADAELEACCADLRMVLGPNQADWLRSVRRPKPPSKDEALDELSLSLNRGYLKKNSADIIRRALESLPD